MSSRGEEATLLRTISYNLRKNHAIGEVIGLATDFDLDVLCLQECDTAELPAEIGALHLADSTKRNRLGLAVYYRRDRFTAVSTTALPSRSRCTTGSSGPRTNACSAPG